MKILEKSKKPFKIIEYLKEGFSYNELRKILTKLNLNPSDIIRNNEKDYKENYKPNMNHEDLINLIVRYPKIFERPIIINKNKAVIGRPPENIYKIL